MKKAWYLYCNDFNYGQREKGIDAIRSIENDAGVRFFKDRIIRDIQKGICETGDYKAVKEFIKI